MKIINFVVAFGIGLVAATPFSASAYGQKQCGAVYNADGTVNVKIYCCTFSTATGGSKCSVFKQKCSAAGGSPSGGNNSAQCYWPVPYGGGDATELLCDPTVPGECPIT